MKRNPRPNRRNVEHTFGNGTASGGSGDLTVIGPARFKPQPDMLLKARRMVCARAVDAADAAGLLAMLGLLGEDDNGPVVGTRAQADAAKRGIVPPHLAAGADT